MNSRWVVEHLIHGSGLVMTTPVTMGSGLPVVVRFAHGLECLPRGELRTIDGARWPGLGVPGFKGEQLSLGQRDASRWLEALRLGTVVSTGVGSTLFTVGREGELAQVEEDLRLTVEEGGAFRVFCGPYGVGKSHLLGVVAETALCHGLAVSRVVLDRDRVSASRPRRLYHEMVQGLTFPRVCGFQDGIAGLAQLFDRAVASNCCLLSEQPWQRHSYLTPALTAWKGLNPEHHEHKRELLYWISGGDRTNNRRLRGRLRRAIGRDPGGLYALKDHRTVWNQLTYLLTGLSALLRETGVANGLTVIVDEAELCAVETSSQRKHSDRCFTGLAAAALGGRAVNRPELLRELGGHQVTRDFPAFYRGRNHLYLALGMATRDSGRDVLARLLPKSTFSDLSPLSPVAVAALIERILVVYRHAFPHFEVGSGFAHPLGQLIELRGSGSCSPRQIVQQALAFLDGARLWPNSIESYIEECLGAL